MLGESATFAINGNFSSLKKKFSINFSKVKTQNFALVCFVNEKEIFKLKADNKNVNFPIQFCLVSMSNGFRATESREVSLNGNLYNFSVDYNSIDKSDILDIHKYLMTKNNIK